MPADPYNSLNFEGDLETLCDKASDSGMSMEDIISILEDQIADLQANMEAEDESEEDNESGEPESA